MSSDIIITTLTIPITNLTVFKLDTTGSAIGNDAIQSFGNQSTQVIPQDLHGIWNLLLLGEDDLDNIKNSVANIRVRLTFNSPIVLTYEDILNLEVTFQLEFPAFSIPLTTLESINVSDVINDGQAYFDIAFPLKFLIKSDGTYNDLLRKYALGNSDPLFAFDPGMTTSKLKSYWPNDIHTSAVAGSFSIKSSSTSSVFLIERRGASFTTLMMHMFNDNKLKVSATLKSIEKMSPSLTTNFGFLKSSGSIVTFDELRQSSSTTQGSVSSVISLLQKILVNLFSDRGSNRFNTQMGTALFSVLGYTLTETDLLKELTLAVSNTEQILLAEQIGESTLSADEKLKSLRVVSVNINQDVATVKIRVQTEAGTVLTYPITL